MWPNLSFHLKIITGLSRLPALLSAFIPPLTNKKPPVVNTPFTDSELDFYCVVWGFFFCLPKSADTVSRACSSQDSFVLQGHRDVPWTECGGFILPSPWSCFKVGIILDVRCMEMGFSVLALLMRSCFPLDLMEDREAGKVWCQESRHLGAC